MSNLINGGDTIETTIKRWSNVWKVTGKSRLLTIMTMCKKYNMYKRCGDSVPITFMTTGRWGSNSKCVFLHLYICSWKLPTPQRSHPSKLLCPSQITVHRITSDISGVLLSDLKTPSCTNLKDIPDLTLRVPSCSFLWSNSKRDNNFPLGHLLPLCSLILFGWLHGSQAFCAKCSLVLK